MSSIEVRRDAALSVAKGLSVAILVTIGGMALLALLVVRAALADDALLALNQSLKVVSVCAGALAAVGFGGRRGFALGATTGLLYMVLGYATNALLGGGAVSYPVMALEFLMGAAIGGLAGALCANLRAPKRRAKKTGRHAAA